MVKPSSVISLIAEMVTSTSMRFSVLALFPVRMQTMVKRIANTATTAPKPRKFLLIGLRLSNAIFLLSHIVICLG